MNQGGDRGKTGRPSTHGKSIPARSQEDSTQNNKEVESQMTFQHHFHLLFTI